MKAGKNEVLLYYEGYKNYKWTDIYDTEDELIEDLRNIEIRISGVAPTKGYQYLASFQKVLQEGKQLSNKQITQLKRLAASVAFEKYRH